MRPKSINYPKLNGELAEFIGLLAGDGHVNDLNYEVSISGHLILDCDYLEQHVKNLFIKLFQVNVKLKKHIRNTNLRCVVNSKELVTYLVETFKLPLGKKKGKLNIPSQIFMEKEYLQSYIRGLFDTDGSVYRRRKKDIVVSIISRDIPFLEQIFRGIQSIGFRPSMSGKNLYLYGNDQASRFFREIRPANKKHLDRYDRFIKEIKVQ